MRAVALFALALGGCASHPVLVPRVPAAELLAPCVMPDIPPATPTNIEAAVGWVQAVHLALECAARHAALVDFERAAPAPK